MEIIDRDEWLPGGYANRAMCDVLGEMRETLKIVLPLNVHLRGLVEEAQTIANRMEAGLADKRNYYELMRELRKRVKAMRFPERSKDE